MTGAPGPVIVKLGGSVITRKRGPPRVRRKVLHRLAVELAATTPGGLIVLHGAGSFGHPGAVRWHLADPPTARSDRGRRRGAALVSAEVRRLHGYVLAELLDAGIPAWSVPPAALATNREGESIRFDAGPFQAALASGMCPVSFGDVVPDESWGHSILSADTIALSLGRQLGAARVIFVSDVEGVLRRAPGAPGRPEVFPRIDATVAATLVPSPGVPDVTGGIRGKARTMIALGELGVRTGLISGLRHGALSRAVEGETVYGSWSGPGPT
ncbi:MAG TPA: isopentenyl phosphate kinase [Thermoplasmata archaeon]|nr:isopentenyl phosphate kinase [Thermoplasmata archaeon]